MRNVKEDRQVTLLPLLDNIQPIEIKFKFSVVNACYEAISTIQFQISNMLMPNEINNLPTYNAFQDKRIAYYLVISFV